MVDGSEILGDSKVDSGPRSCSPSGIPYWPLLASSREGALHGRPGAVRGSVAALSSTRSWSPCDRRGPRGGISACVAHVKVVSSRIQGAQRREMRVGESKISP